MKNKEFKSFYKVVGGGEGDRCNYPVLILNINSTKVVTKITSSRHI
jgi:hypothetical protein